MRSRLIADVPLGVFLSGGLDSTLWSPRSPRGRPASRSRPSLSATTSAGERDGKARLTAQELGAEHHELVLTPDQLLERVPALSGAGPALADQALVLLHAIAEYARRDVTVAIGDEGADELFGGYSRYRWLWRSERPGLGQAPAALHLAAGSTVPRYRGAIREAGLSGDLAAV